MADPIQTITGPAHLTTWGDIINQNFRDRFSMELTTITDTSADADLDTEYVELDATTSGAALTLDNAVTWDNKTIYVHAIDVTNTVTIDGDGTNINGSATLVMDTLGDFVMLHHNGTVWFAWKMPRLQLGASPMAVVAKTTTYTATDSDELILADATGGAFTVALPTAVGRVGKIFRVKKTDAVANNVTVDGDGSETIDGATTQVITTQYDTVPCVSDGTEWWII